MPLRAPLQGPEFPFEQLLTLIEHSEGLTSDSRKVEQGVIFAAFPGENGDGRAWIDDAIERGASAIIWDPEGCPANPEWSVPHIAVPDLRWEISRIASFFYGDPSWEIKTIGVTGTNGKTSCTHWIAQALTAVQKPCGLIGTLGAGMLGALEMTGFTTPGPIELQLALRNLKREGAQAVAIEVSSHGLTQGRVDGVHFEVALFTNLTHDHLDYHGSIEAYGEAKALLFHAASLRKAVINVDDDFGFQLFQQLVQEEIPAVAYSLQEENVLGVERLYASDIHFDSAGTRFQLHTPSGQTLEINTPLLGTFNVSNVLGVAGVLLEMGVLVEQLPEVLAQLKAPPGRMEQIDHPAGFKVVIDYAHTPDALSQALDALRPSVSAGHRLFTIFGCGGERDIDKRPRMGAIAEEKADLVILTSDNPRTEDPISILHQIADGMKLPPYGQMLDRKLAITQALLLAQSGDVVLIAGKGHEEYQDIQGQKIPFSDREIVRQLIAAATPSEDSAS